MATWSLLSEDVGRRFKKWLDDTAASAINIFLPERSSTTLTSKETTGSPSGSSLAANAGLSSPHISLVNSSYSEEDKTNSWDKEPWFDPEVPTNIGRYKETKGWEMRKEPDADANAVMDDINRMFQPTIANVGDIVPNIKYNVYHKP